MFLWCKKFYKIYREWKYNILLCGVFCEFFICIDILSVDCYKLCMDLLVWCEFVCLRCLWCWDVVSSGNGVVKVGEIVV